MASGVSLHEALLFVWFSCAFRHLYCICLGHNEDITETSAISLEDERRRRSSGVTCLRRKTLLCRLGNPLNTTCSCLNCQNRVEGTTLGKHKQSVGRLFGGLLVTLILYLLVERGDLLLETDFVEFQCGRLTQSSMTAEFFRVELATGAKQACPQSRCQQAVRATRTALWTTIKYIWWTDQTNCRMKTSTHTMKLWRPLHGQQARTTWDLVW